MSDKKGIESMRDDDVFPLFSATVKTRPECLLISLGGIVDNWCAMASLLSEVGTSYFINR
jgi:hypothetical protein